MTWQDDWRRDAPTRLLATGRAAVLAHGGMRVLSVDKMERFLLLSDSITHSITHTEKLLGLGSSLRVDSHKKSLFLKVNPAGPPACDGQQSNSLLGVFFSFFRIAPYPLYKVMDAINGYTK